MKAVTYAALFLGLLSAALAQEDPGPSPTESVGCVPHNDHWDCEGPRVTTQPTGVTTTATTGGTDTAITSAPALTTTSSAGDEDDEDHTDAPGTGSLGPSPTESFGCEPHGDHWHCEGHVTETLSGPGTSSTPTGGAGAVTTSSTPTGGAARHEATGMALAGLVAVAAMAL
ncbi:hypothetical protein MFIFM68171_00115 [Madurella fahalii]|uniref:Uncharacterized protein n=1 Tax=Madurella fahalii TaxID=1157608 RepID=A0ABQ0FWL8_9PEZI